MSIDRNELSELELQISLNWQVGASLESALAALARLARQWRLIGMGFAAIAVAAAGALFMWMPAAAQTAAAVVLTGATLAALFCLHTSFRLNSGIGPAGAMQAANKEACREAVYHLKRRGVG